MKRGMTAEDIYALAMLSEAALSPDGRTTACVETRLLESEQDYKGVLRLTGACTRTINQGHGCAAPAFSPDGGTLAFLSKTDGAKQLWVVQLPDGVPKKCTSLRYDIRQFVWAPDGKTIYFVSESDKTLPFEKLLSEITPEEKKAEEDAAKNRPRIIRDIVHKWDGEGYLTGRKTQIWALSLSDGTVRMLTDADTNFRELSISADGTKLVFVSDPLEDNDYRPQDVNLWIYDLEKDRAERVINDAIYITNPVFLNADEILFTGHQSELGWGTINRLYTFDLMRGVFSCISRKTDLSINNTAIGDFQKASQGFAVDGKSGKAYFTASEKGSTCLFSADRSGTIEKVLPGAFVIQSVAFNADFSKAVCVIGDPLHPARLFELEPASGALKAVYDPNAALLDEMTLAPYEKIQIESFDGVLIDGWIVKPPEFDENRRYPAIIEIHGGPQMMYAENFMHEFQLLVSKGYVVAFFNPRGSSGYGQRFKSLIRREYGGEGAGDYMDIMAGTDYVAALPYVDENHMGVTGGSYGGFMTNWIVGHTNRFRAAVTQRSISNWNSFIGSSDYGFCDAELAHQCDFFDEKFELERISPISYVKNIKTPLLILHSEFDYRCPLEQAEQLFTSLKLLRQTVELRIFPGQSHGLSRTGRPSLRIARLASILEWFEKYI